MLSRFIILGFHKSLCVSMGNYGRLWESMADLGAYMWVYRSIWGFMEVWMNMRSGWVQVYKCVCRYMRICVCMGAYGELWV